ncbi:hypothetical protein [Snuella sedimenti]|uniref:Uncharacterized protein n=1 Tax=Snuella sedimenti TaxID=2798802 RepID=A0A8J7IZP9_9FLAO|nr:hypothetical protein [Snuella sedimenti]MBJ6369635.1 hypothetical protein [Snuella sedimenti]
MHTEKNTIGFFIVEPSALFSEYTQKYEKASWATEGKLKPMFNRDVIILALEMIAAKPSSTIIDSAQTRTYCEDADVFYPIREDYKNL